MRSTRLLSSAILLSLSASAMAAGPAQRALNDLRANGALAAAASGDNFLARVASIDGDGVETVRFNREYLGKRVIGGDIVVQSKNGQVQNVSNSLQNFGRPQLKAKLDPDSATVEAGSLFGGQIHLLRNNGLVIYAHDHAPTLAYEVKVRGFNANHMPADRLFYIDANTGGLLGTDDRLKTAWSTGTGNTLLLGKQRIITDKQGAGKFVLQDPTRGNGPVLDGKGKTYLAAYESAQVMTNTKNVWGNGTESDVASEASDAHYGISRTWDFYRQVFNRKGIFNDGVGVRSIVNVSFPLLGDLWVTGGNAAWDGDQKTMLYGYGDEDLYPVVALDVAGHEMTHGVTEAVNGLLYENDSGGLDEASSDIMGTMVEFFANRTEDPGDYLIGEKLFRSNPDGTSALRSMFRPSSDGASYDCYPAAGFKGVDPHYSSGPANLFFYLLAEGTAQQTLGGVVHKPNTCKTSDGRVATGASNLAGIGRSKARKIWYRAMDKYFTSGTTYPQARAATIRAASDLHGRNSVEVASVKAAWSAIKVN